MRTNTEGIHVWLVLWRATEAVAAHARRHIRSLDLGLSDFAVLEALHHRGPLPVNVIGEKVLLTSGSITSAVDRLEAGGLVRRQPDPDDRRVRLVSLTPAGARLMRREMPKHRAAMERATAGLKAGEREALVMLLRKLGKGAIRSLEERPAPKRSA